MNLQLEGKNVLITGGSKGIGKGIAKAFLKEGAHVTIAARNVEDLETAAEEIGGAAILELNVTDETHVHEQFEKYISRNGTLDVLINNAGGSQGGAVLYTELQEFKEAMELNFYSAVRLSQLAGAHMKQRRSGAIVQISSIFGKESGGKPTYNASKSALISFTKSFADEMIPNGVRVNSVAPGSILHPTGNWQKRLEKSPQAIQQFVDQNIPAGRFGTVEEVANVVVFLASPMASWVVGTTVTVDGGQSYMNA
ncbi:SDR family NAD(P)-dependent oxidoreductase [Aureibacillus halotolerans]|uniref:3-oxoacyl-[acyl-carrier protein] reductase n=1 Tax=Aureibacillus halotolerans TaxID=1508390 RepID=A0A4R6TTF1_9BACI|nr:SDR family oxidoreductase [Aureibacillus halotolerans]TDQ33747.1 3-oxoacyl-[acyl-carrier protein] reductase [Aureibacillus halotolerans]